MDPLRERIEADIRNETHASRMRSIFETRDKAKRPPPERFTAFERLQSPVSTENETPDCEGDASDGFDWWHAAQGDYDSVCENQTGRFIPETVFETGRLRRAQQDETTVELAKALDSTGRFEASPFYRGENDPSRCSVIGVFSGAVLPMASVKRSSVLPSIAKANRAAMLRFIEYFLNTLPGSGRKAAMFTITNGPRVQNHPVILREGIKGFHRWLSKIAAGPDFKRWGLRMEWRASEFGKPQASAESGQLEWHLHAHCLVTVPERMTHRQRSKMRKKMWKVFGVVWDDAGDIKNPREFVKYPVKDSDLTTVVREFGPGALADFYEAIRGLHIVQPMGDVRAMRKRFRNRPSRITPFTRLDGRTLEETGDWNAVKRPIAGPNKNKRAFREKTLALAARLACAAHCASVGNAAGDASVSPGETPVTPPETGRFEGDSDEDAQRRGDSSRKSPRIANRVIARLSPAPYGSPVLEPGVVVWGFDGNIAAVLAQPVVARIIARHRASFEDAMAARALIRACADAGADAQACAPRAAKQGSQRSNNCPGVLGELALADASGSPPGYENPDFWHRISP